MMTPYYYLYWKEGEHFNFKQFLTQIDLNNFLASLGDREITYIHVVSGYTLEERGEC